MKNINKDQLRKKLRNDEITLIEVLKPEAYERGHIKGAVNIPLANIVTEARKRFSENDEIAVYCSDYKCTASPTAAKKLENSGFKHVYDFQGGKKEWQDAGYAMEKN